MKLLIFSLLLMTGFSVHAEYRAFELVITDSTSGSKRIVLSQMDPLQYVRYHPVKASEIVQYQDTWRCRGNTSWFQPICPKPLREPKAPSAATTTRP